VRAPKSGRHCVMLPLPPLQRRDSGSPMSRELHLQSPLEGAGDRFAQCADLAFLRENSEFMISRQKGAQFAFKPLIA
jgi:hypothetical protein